LGDVSIFNIVSGWYLVISYNSTSAQAADGTDATEAVLFKVEAVVDIIWYLVVPGTSTFIWKMILSTTNANYGFYYFINNREK